MKGHLYSFHTQVLDMQGSTCLSVLLPHRGLASALLPLGWLSHAIDDGGHVGRTIELDLRQATAVGGYNPRDLCRQRKEVKQAASAGAPGTAEWLLAPH